MKQDGITPKTHSRLRNQFGLHFVKEGHLPTQFADMLNDAEELRALAEYAEERVITREDAEVTLRNANEFVDHMSKRLRDAA